MDFFELRFFRTLAHVLNSGYAFDYKIFYSRAMEKYTMKYIHHTHIILCTLNYYRWRILVWSLYTSLNHNFKHFSPIISVWNNNLNIYYSKILCTSIQTSGRYMKMFNKFVDYILVIVLLTVWVNMIWFEKWKQT